MQKKEIEKYLDNIIGNLLKAKTSYEIHWLLKGEKTREEYINIMNKYPSFFIHLINMSFDSFIINTSKTIENNKKTINFHKLFEQINIKQGIKNKFDTYKEKNQSITVIRSNISAHNSQKINHEETLKKANITYDETREHIHNLILLTHDIYQELLPEEQDSAPMNGRKLTSYEKLSQYIEQAVPDEIFKDKNTNYDKVAQDLRLILQKLKN